ncbi:uncharacterized protein [Ptychodera flava]|uniref:uncharacterized protein n=1 Tax=Ptychodera flava TaxID=63121 RepID=UPI00396A5977
MANCDSGNSAKHNNKGMMANTLSEALLVSASWNTESDDLTLQPTKTLVNDVCENTLKSDEVSKLYCTVLDVEVSEDQKKDAESVGVTLIPATRSKWSDPVLDPPVLNWLLNHDKYYPGLKELKHIKHVVSFSPMTKNAAAAIHESLFPQAQLHQLSPPEQNGVLFTFDIWNKDACGLTNYHRTIIHDFCVRKTKAGEQLIAYSTVIDVELSEDQKTDAKKCGVTLIPAKRKERGTMKKDLPKLDWLLKHEIHYPDLGKLKNIKYVVGYAPKTGWAAADIKETLFPDAKLVLINHAFPEKNCLFKMDDDEVELEEDMLKMAKEADMLFSIGPKIYEYFKNAYRATFDGTQLSDIPHEEILPKPGQLYFDGEVVNGTDTGTCSILTYGQLDTQEALITCESIAASIGNVANNLKECHEVCPDWKVKGVSEQDIKKTWNFLIEKLNSAHVMPKLYPTYSVQKLLRVLQQSHLCLPPSCYTDYSFEGLEAMAAGLPTRVQDDSHIASMIKKHFPMHTDFCVMTSHQTHMEQEISRSLTSNTEAFDHAKILKEDFSQSEVVTESLAKFAAVFKEEKRTKKSDSDALMVHVGLCEESYQQQISDLDKQSQTMSVREKKEQSKAAWKKIQAELDKTESEVLTNNTSLQRVDHNCRNSFGEGTVTKSTKRDSLAISLDLPTLYNLYRLKQTCLSGSFPDSFEPLLITDKMREEADKVGLQLKLKATYDQARFDELELFFINRDGGGLEPVKMYHDVIEGEDDEEILIDDEDTGQKSDTMVTGRIDGSSQTEQGQSTEDIQSKSEMERATLESQLKEAKEEKGTLEERCKELTQKLESTEQSLVSQRIGNSMEREKLQSELEQNQKLIKELQDKVAELEHQLEQSDLKKQGGKGDWSVTLVNGQHKDQGQKFKSPRGLAFHRDKLVVCDSDNNIVQILNKDYTCDKVIGSFDGQFTKPFRPLSVAISRFNHYFILDDENKQIVVCDENGKIIQIITLPENIKVVWDIALMDDFVLVTLSLTSPDTSVRPEDRDDRLVKYTQSGEYLAEVNGQIRGQGQFSRPVSVVVNSNNVIMVYDGGNRCIKCFDSDLNFLHQFGQSQLSEWSIVGYGSIAVDEDDNVYVCYNFDRIVKYRCDGKWICDLLEGNVRYPMYIAVMGDKIGVVERGSDQIKVFSK